MAGPQPAAVPTSGVMAGPQPAAGPSLGVMAGPQPAAVPSSGLMAGPQPAAVPSCGGVMAVPQPAAVPSSGAMQSAAYSLNKNLSHLLETHLKQSYEYQHMAAADVAGQAQRMIDRHLF